MITKLSAGLVGITAAASTIGYSGPQNLQISAVGTDGKTLAIDINGDGTVDFSLNAFASSTSFSQSGVRVDLPDGNRYASTDATSGFAQPLTNEQLAGLTYSTTSGVLLTQGKNAAGVWPLGVDRYLGIQFQANGASYYGWAKVKIDETFTPDGPSDVKADAGLNSATATVTGWAYACPAGAGIVAGDTGGATAATATSCDSAVPEPSTLALLALGAAGLGLLKSRRKS